MSIVFPKKQIPYYIFLFLLIFTPLAFGTVELWSVTIMEASCFVAVLFYFYNEKSIKSIYEVPGLVPLIFILCYMFLQMIPLPAGLVGFLSPKTLALYEGTIGIVEMPGWLTLSVNPRSTLGEFFRFTAYASFYVLAVQLLTDRKRLKQTVLIVLSLCAFIALQAILQKYLDNGRIYWLREAPSNSSFTGPFVYHNHFAGYVEMLAPVAIALFFRYRPLMNYGDSLQQRLVNALSHPYFNTYLLLGFIAVLLSVSIFVSMSRGGMISFVLSSFLLLAVLAKKEKNNNLIYLALLLLAVILIAIGWFGWDAIDQRFGMMFDNNGDLQKARLLIWEDAIGTIKDFFFTGTGWGTFGNIYPTYRTYIENRFAYHAYNDFIETLTNGGFVSLVLICWFFVSVIRQIVKVLVKRRDSYAIYLTWGSLAGILAVIFHAVADFNFQNGANGLYFFFLLALAVSSAHTHTHGIEPTILKAKKISNIGYIVLIGTCFLLFTASLTENVSSIRVNSQLASIMQSRWNTETPEDELKNIKVRLENALSISPYNSYIYYLLADVENTLGDAEAAARYYKKAIRLNPTQATYLQNYGMFLDKHGERSLADAMMRAGIRHDRNEPDRKRNYARFLFNANENEKGLQVMTTVFVQDPEKAVDDVAFLVEKEIPDPEIRLNLPARVIPLLAFAEHLEQKGDAEQAAVIYYQALDNIGNEKVVRLDYFLKVSKFFREQKRYEEALDVILKAIILFPASADLRVAAGNLYEDMGLIHRAAEEYRLALVIDPGGTEARRQLGILQQDTD